ncbi:MAG TPA: carboxylating nicotinate-nucleotide diphosphorylase [Streptosporangiaceae bacterium]|nr:carboxylating nicotinate-nucleotide diphosphorylase [Streptosporangiaceae bacterium]
MTTGRMTTGGMTTGEALSPEVVALLTDSGLDLADTARAVREALDEDLAWGPDVTTAALPGVAVPTLAEVVARQPGVLAGLPVAVAVLAAAGLPHAGTGLLRRDGEQVASGDAVLRIQGPLEVVLRAERTVLNFLTHLSGVATSTRAWVDAVAGTGCIVRDTRKTIPGLRRLEKYAVRCGGGTNHRMGLGDAALVKDNHVAAAGGITAAVAAVREAWPGVPLEVECDTLGQVSEALAAGVSLILLDNMGLDDLRAAIALGSHYPAARFEASGGLRLATARAVAETGVHYIAVGALTHSSPALDLALDLQQP